MAYNTAAVRISAKPPPGSQASVMATLFRGLKCLFSRSCREIRVCVFVVMALSLQSLKLIEITHSAAIRNHTLAVVAGFVFEIR
jgi:hypothetical protein